MIPKLTFIKADTLAVEFAYDARRVADLRLLARRRWNKKMRRWEVHLGHLPDLMRIFELDEAAVEPAILARWNSDWRAAPVKVTLGPVKGRIVGPSRLLEIDAAASFPIEGHQFSPLFKKGLWDGRKHLFSVKSGRFPAGLWPRIEGVLRRCGIAYAFEKTLSAKKSPDSGKLVFAPPPTALREYQRAALEKALLGRRGIVQIATGGGKTVLAAHLIARLARPTFFFVHTIDLLHQAARVFERELGVEIGMLGDGQARLRPVTVATVQTAARVLAVKPDKQLDAKSDQKEKPVDLDEAAQHEVQDALQNAEVAIFDECHHISAGMFYNVALKMENARWRFGLSATPWRDDGHDLMLEAALGPKIAGVDCSSLIDLGFLIAPSIALRAPGGPVLRKRGLSYQEIYKMAIVENAARNRAIAAQAEAWAGEGLSVLVLVNHIAHGERLQTLLPAARLATGELDSERRKVYLEDLERKLHPILIATTLADEGLDLPSLDCLILAGGGKSQTRAYQRIGRALRPAPGKTTARVLDFLDEAPYLREHSRARLDLYRAEPRFLIALE